MAVTGVGTTTLAYDYEGRVTTITYPSTATNTFTYNGLDTRVSKVDSTDTRTYLRDGAGVTAPVLSDGAANYTPGISEKRSGTTTYSHSGFKNAESQSGSGQTVLATKTFDAFGNLDTSSGTWKGPFGYGGPHGYQSDPDSGLMLLGHRYYDSSTGRFLTRDPVKDGRNWYVYCDGNPTAYVDHDGLQVRYIRAPWINRAANTGRGSGSSNSPPSRPTRPGGIRGPYMPSDPLIQLGHTGRGRFPRLGPLNQRKAPEECNTRIPTIHIPQCALCQATPIAHILIRKNPTSE